MPEVKDKDITYRLNLDHEDFEKSLDRINRKVTALLQKLELVKQLQEDIDARNS